MDRRGCTLHQSPAGRGKRQRLPPAIRRRILPRQQPSCLQTLYYLPGSRPIEANCTGQSSLIKTRGIIDRDKGAVLRRRQAERCALLDEDTDCYLVRPTKKETRACIQLLEGDRPRHRGESIASGRGETSHWRRPKFCIACRMYTYE